MNPHTSAAIAQLVFYVPMVPLTLYLCIRNWKYGPRMAWYPPVPFSLIRLVGAILIIVEEQNTGNRGLIIATIVLLNIGLIPLLVCLLGIVRLVLESNFKGNKKTKTIIYAIRYNILGAVGLLSASGGFAGQPEHAHTQATLSKIAYIQFTCVLVALISICLVLYLKHGQIKDGDIIYIRWALIVSPALCVRTAFGLISVFEAAGNRILTSIWSPLFGSAVAFSLMALLPEYITLCIYLYLGIHRLRTGRQENLGETSEEQHYEDGRNTTQKQDDFIGMVVDAEPSRRL